MASIAPLQLCVPVTDIFRQCRAELLPLVGALSFKEPSDEVFRSKAHLLESSLQIADPRFRSKLRRSGFLAAMQTGDYVSFSCDIGPNCRTVREYSPNGLPRAVPLSSPVSDEEYLGLALENVEWLRGEYSGYLHLENLNYFPTGGYERVCDPDFICRLTEATGAGLLLDIGHAVISARNLSYSDPLSYILELPLHSVLEIHVSHAGLVNGIFEDLHEAPGEDDLALVESVADLGQSVEYLTVEYYRDPRILCDIYRHISEDLTALGNRAVL